MTQEQHGEDERVVAYELATGNEIWRFHAEAPVRFAPVVHEDKLFFVSDDGHLYALNTENGQLLWKFNGVKLSGRVMRSWVF